MKTLCLGLALFISVLFTAAARAGTFTDQLEGNLVTLKDKKAEPLPKGALTGKKIIALYYSAHWCPPCRAFTPELVKEYAALAAKYPDFQLVFVSSDRDAAAMTEYMNWADMKWPALAYDKSKSIQAVNALSSDGIPYLAVVDPDGKQLLGKAAGQDWVPPQEILEKLKALLAKGGSQTSKHPNWN
jgi:nucleoredoxin